ncbi:ATP-binding protein [bacterium]|nr:ATP-binding protein [bacterium]MDB4781138.1 ATP-binding protein [Akkermansiaceae bacterium]
MGIQSTELDAYHKALEVYEADFAFFEGINESYKLEGQETLLAPFFSYFTKELGFKCSERLDLISPLSFFKRHLEEYRSKSAIHSLSSDWIRICLEVNRSNDWNENDCTTDTDALINDCASYSQSVSWAHLHKFFPFLFKSLITPLNYIRPLDFSGELSGFYPSTGLCELMLKCASVDQGDWVVCLAGLNPAMAGLLEQTKPISRVKTHDLINANFDTADLCNLDWEDPFEKGVNPSVTFAFSDTNSRGIASVFHLLSGRRPDSLIYNDSLDENAYPWRGMKQCHILSSHGLSDKDPSTELSELLAIGNELQPGSNGCAIIHNILFSAAKGSDSLKSELLRSGCIRTVINIWKDYSLLILGPKQSGEIKVKFVDATDLYHKNLVRESGLEPSFIGYPPQEIRNPNTGLPFVSKILNRLDQKYSKYVTFVEAEAIEKNDYILNPRFYINPVRLKIKAGEKKCKIKDLLEPLELEIVRLGHSPRNGDWESFGVKYLGESDLPDLDISVPSQAGELRQIRNAAVHSGEIHAIKNNCILINRGCRGRKHFSYYLETNGSWKSLAPGLRPFSVNEKLVNPKWLVFALRTNHIYPYLRDLSDKAGAMFLNLDIFLNTILVVPNLEIQQRELEIYTEQLAKGDELKKGLGREIAETRETFRDELSLRRHSLAQTNSNLQASISNLQLILQSKGNIGAEDIVSPSRNMTFSDYLKDLEDVCSKLGKEISELNEQTNLQEIEAVKLKDFFEEFTKEAIWEGIKSYRIDYVSESFEIEGAVQAIEPIVGIGKGNLRTILTNIVDNAKRHGFSEKNGEPSIEIVVLLDAKSQNIEIHCKNNGRPFPRNLDTRRYTLKGEKAGKSGNSGLGGFHVKEIMNHVKGKVEIVDDPQSDFPVNVILKFPLYHE